MEENKLEEQKTVQPEQEPVSTEAAEPKTADQDREENPVPDALTPDPKEPYVERPKGQRIFAWVLFGIIIAGVLLYYFWIAKGGRL